MFYATGGWAYGALQNDLTVPGVGSATRRYPAVRGQRASASKLPFDQNLTAKLEYLYLDTGSIDN